MLADPKCKNEFCKPFTCTHINSTIPPAPKTSTFQALNRQISTTLPHRNFFVAFKRDWLLTLDAAGRGCIGELDAIFAKYSAHQIATFKNKAGGCVHTNTELSTILRKNYGFFER